MAQLNITLNQEEILLLVNTDRNEAFRKLFQDCLNGILRAESEEQLKAAPNERTEERTDYRNGTRERVLNTRIGKIVLDLPRHRNQPFKSMIFENYSRSETALIATMTEMVVNGVSTRKIAQVVETLCGTTFSKSTVSELCRDLDKKVNEFRNRPLQESYPFLTVDATYFKARENHRIVSKAFMVAYGTNDQGHREILGFDVYRNESSETWNAFLKSLKNRGLHGLLMITSDAHEGLCDAISKVFPDVAWQRCQFHFSKNISEKAPKKYQAGIRSELQEMFNARTMAAARKKRDSIIHDYQDVAEAATTCLDEGFETAMTVMILPERLRKLYRTSNHIERLNAELKRRSKVIGVFPNEASILRLMGSVLIERNEIIVGRNALFTTERYKAMLETGAAAKLIELAHEQHRLQVA